MRITQITPGTGSFYCGSCLRDHAATIALRERGHDVTMLPLYLPFMLEDHPRPRPERVFMGGINLFLQHKVQMLSRLPRFVANRLDSPKLLAWSSTKGDMTGASKLGEMTLSMLRGEDGRQVAEINRFIDWLDQQPKPDVIVLSNVLLAGLARPLRQHLGVPIVCTLHGEDAFLDSLPEPWGTRSWDTLRERAGEIDQFVAVSKYYGSAMADRLGVPADKIEVVHNGIDLRDFDQSAPLPAPDRPTLGYLARMCPDKGLATLVEAFIHLKKTTNPDLQLRVAGVAIGSDWKFIESLRKRLAEAGCLDDVSFQANIAREQKLAHLRSLSVFSVPATYGESFGLYLIEAMAAGVPVVQPRHAAFPEVIARTGGGLLCEPDDAVSLADQIGGLLSNPGQREQLASQGRSAVFEHFGAERMAVELEQVYQRVVAADQESAKATPSATEAE